jgi:hypothetical protein
VANLKCGEMRSSEAMTSSSMTICARRKHQRDGVQSRRKGVSCVVYDPAARA